MNTRSLSIDPTLVFGPFTLHRARKLLLDGGRPVKLGGRAFDILVALVERAGEVVGKQHLADCVWPNLVVEESSLRVHVSALRKALGDGQNGVRYIANVAGRGYCFVAPVQTSIATSAAAPTVLGAHNLPARLTRLVGREDSLRTLERLLPASRFVTIVGPGGMGKTTLAFALAEHVLPRFRDGVRFVDLAATADSLQLYSAVASTIGVTLAPHRPLEALIDQLNSREMLLILDNCEHVADDAAHFAMQILQHANGIQLLATSREPLFAPAECLHRLSSLSMPSSVEELTASEAMSHSSVQLFVERAIASVEGFELTDANAESVARLCQYLDGMPLAIELAAAQVASFGILGLTRELEDRLSLLSTEQRTTLLRHRTLKSMLDWSYTALSEVDQTVIARLSVFRGPFTLEAAVAIAGDPTFGLDEVVRSVGNLSDKSLLIPQIIDQSVSYRLLTTTRAYAASKLDDSGTTHVIRRRHAEYLCAHFDTSQREQPAMAAGEWREVYGILVDDVRYALDWAHSSPEDNLLAVQLTAAVIPLGYQLSLMDEVRNRVVRAVKVLENIKAKHPLLETRLRSSLEFIDTVMADKEAAATAAPYHLAQLPQSNFSPNQSPLALTNIWVANFGAGRFSDSLATADALTSIARISPDPLAMLAADRMRALSLHYMGEHDAAANLLERVLQHPTGAVRLSMSVGTPIDRRVSMRIQLARIRWLQGYPEQASALAAEAIELSQGDVPFSLCQAIAYAACPIALWNGEIEKAATLVARLIRHCERIYHPHYLSWARNYENVTKYLREENCGSGRDIGSLALTMNADSWQKDMFATISIEQLTQEAIERAVKGTVGWCAPETLRAQGECLLRDKGDVDEAAHFFTRALTLAQAQKATAWELRSAVSLAKLKIGTAEYRKSILLVKSILSRYSEGFESADFKHASTLPDA